MRQQWFVYFAILLFACVTGCSGIDVKTDFDETADFSKFRTFAFAGMTDLSQAGVLSNSLMRKRIEGAIARELTIEACRIGPESRSPRSLLDGDQR